MHWKMMTPELFKLLWLTSWDAHGWLCHQSQLRDVGVLARDEVYSPFAVLTLHLMVHRQYFVWCTDWFSRNCSVPVTFGALIFLETAQCLWHLVLWFFLETAQCRWHLVHWFCFLETAQCLWQCGQSNATLLWLRISQLWMILKNLLEQKGLAWCSVWDGRVIAGAIDSIASFAHENVLIPILILSRIYGPTHPLPLKVWRGMKYTPLLQCWHFIWWCTDSILCGALIGFLETAQCLWHLVLWFFSKLLSACDIWCFDFFSKLLSAGDTWCIDFVFLKLLSACDNVDNLMQRCCGCEYRNFGWSWKIFWSKKDLLGAQSGMGEWSQVQLFFF